MALGWCSHLTRPGVAAALLLELSDCRSHGCATSGVLDQGLPVSQPALHLQTLATATAVGCCQLALAGVSLKPAACMHAGFLNCNGEFTDGCEVNKRIDPDNCELGGCARAMFVMLPPL